jgi:hypothetical protein
MRISTSSWVGDGQAPDPLARRGQDRAANARCAIVDGVVTTGRHAWLPARYPDLAGTGVGAGVRFAENRGHDCGVARYSNPIRYGLEALGLRGLAARLVAPWAQ